jgi:hypothetical protein
MASERHGSIRTCHIRERIVHNHDAGPSEGGVENDEGNEENEGFNIFKPLRAWAVCSAVMAPARNEAGEALSARASRLRVGCPEDVGACSGFGACSDRGSGRSYAPAAEQMDMLQSNRQSSATYVVGCGAAYGP